MSGVTVALGTPNPRQREFLQCRKKYVAFGGARGGGKSWAVRCKAKLLALRYPGIRLLLVRRSLPELEANHLTFLRRELAEVAEYRAGDKRFVFGNGSILQFGYCGSDRDLDRYQGAEYDVIFLDEATQLKELWMGRQRFSQADLLHLQSGRAGAWVHQAAVYRPAVRAGGGPGGLRLYPGEGHGQHGAAGPAAGLSQDAGGAAAQAAAGVAGGALGHHGGTGVSGVYGRPGALRGSPVDPCDTAI